MNMQVDMNRVVEILTARIAGLERELAIATAAVESANVQLSQCAREEAARNVAAEPEE